MATFNSAIPARRAPMKRSFDDSKPNPNGVALPGPGPWPATISKFSKPYWKHNVGTKESPKFEDCFADSVDVNGKPDAVSFRRTYVAFDMVTNRDGAPLVLGKEMSNSLWHTSTQAKMISALTGIPVMEVEKANVDEDTLIGKAVLVSTVNFTAKNTGVYSRIDKITVPGKQMEVLSFAAPAPAAKAAVAQTTAASAAPASQTKPLTVAPSSDDETEMDELDELLDEYESDQIPF